MKTKTVDAQELREAASSPAKPVSRMAETVKYVMQRTASTATP